MFVCDISVLSAICCGGTDRPEDHTMTAAEWIKSVLAQGVVYTRLFDEKLGVSRTAKAVVAKASAELLRMAPP